MTEIPTREEAIARAVEFAYAAEKHADDAQIAIMWATLAPLLPPAPPRPSTLGVTPQQAFQAQIDTIMEDARRILPKLRRRGE